MCKVFKFSACLTQQVNYAKLVLNFKTDTFNIYILLTTDTIILYETDVTWCRGWRRQVSFQETRFRFATPFPLLFLLPPADALIQIYSISWGSGLFLCWERLGESVLYQMIKAAQCRWKRWWCGSFQVVEHCDCN